MKIKVEKTTAVGGYKKDCIQCFGTGIVVDPETDEETQCTCNVVITTAGKYSVKDKHKVKEEEE